MAGRAAFRRTVAPALSGLRAYRGTALLAAATGAVALAAALPVAQLATWSGGVGSRLALAAARALDAGFLWIHPAAGPADLRRDAALLLFKLLCGVAAGLVTVAVLTLLAVFTARASARGPEIAVRRAVGASSRTLVAAQLVEGALVGAAALLIGGGAGLQAARALGAAWPGSLGPATGHLSAVACLAVTGTIVLGALLPVAIVRRPARSTAVDPTPLALAVPAVQLGLSLTVLAAAAMLRLGAERIAMPAAGPGGTSQVYEIGAAALPVPQRAAGYAEVLRRLEADHAVALASLSSPGALVGLGSVAVMLDVTAESAFYAVHHVLSADSFQAMGLRVIAGRGLTAADGWLAPRVAVVNRTLAMHFGGVGGRIFLGYGSDAEHTIVGVVDDVRPVGLGGTFEPRFVVYASVLQHPPAAAQLLVRRARGEPAASDVLSAIHTALGPGASATGPVSEASLFAAEAAPLRWFARAFTAEGWAMLAVATFGTFAVMWLWVTSLLGELGLRRATGATRRRITLYVLARAAAVAAWGMAFGTWLGMMVWDAVHSLSATLPTWDPTAVGWSSLLLGGAALAGTFIPAWRAAHTPPAALISASGG